MAWGFGKAKEKGDQLRRSLSKQDNLERACIVVLGAAAADGNAEQKEIDVGKGLIRDLLGGVFKDREIEEQLDRAEAVFRSRYTAKRRLTEACEQVESEQERDALFTLACDVCAATGEGNQIGDAEDKWLRNTLAPALRVNAASYLD